MNYNDGAVKDITKITDKKKAAHDFSEGNIYLENLLNNCYDNGVITTACCAGHLESNDLPYITFYLAKQNEYYINGMIEYLINLGYQLEFTSFDYANSTFSIRYIDDKRKFDKFFIDINESLEYAKGRKVERSNLDLINQKLINLCLTLNNHFLSSLSYFNGKYNLRLSFDGFMEVVSYDYNNMVYYLDNVIKKVSNYNENKELEVYDSSILKNKEWNSFLAFLKDNNIVLKGELDNDLLDIKGAYAKNDKKIYKMEILENDTIYTIALKLYKLRFFYDINAKININGIEINNIDINEYVDINGRTRYESNFSVYKCIMNYNNYILDKINKEKFNNELIIFDDSPLPVIGFNNNLSEEEITKRIILLKEYKIDLIIYYNNMFIPVGILRKNNQYNISDLENDVLYSIAGSDNLNMLFNMFSIFSIYYNNQRTIRNDLSTFNNFINLYHERIYNNNSNKIDLIRNGINNYINSLQPGCYIDLNTYCILYSLKRLINLCIYYFDDKDGYLQSYMNKIDDINSTESDILMMLSDCLNYIEKISHNEIKI